MNCLFRFCRIFSFAGHLERPRSGRCEPHPHRRDDETSINRCRASPRLHPAHSAGDGRVGRLICRAPSVIRIGDWSIATSMKRLLPARAAGRLTRRTSRIISWGLAKRLYYDPDRSIRRFFCGRCQFDPTTVSVITALVRWKPSAGYVQPDHTRWVTPLYINTCNIKSPARPTRAPWAARARSAGFCGVVVLQAQGDVCSERTARSGEGGALYDYVRTLVSTP